MRRLFPLLLIGAVVLIAGWAVLGQDGTQGPDAASDAPEAVEPSGDAPASPAPLEAVDVDRARSDIEPEAADRAEVAAPEPVAPRSSMQRIEGRVTVEHEGRLFDDLDGTLKLIVHSSSSMVLTGAEVIGGVFTLELELADDVVRIQTDHGRLGGWQVGPGLRSEGALRAPDERFHLELVVRHSPSFEVVASESGVGLVDAVVHEGLGGLMGADFGPVHPGIYPGELLAGPGPSPLELPYSELPRQWAGNVYVGAPGRVWRSVGVDLGSDRAKRVELDLAGSLEVELVGLQDASDLLLRLRGDEPNPFVNVLLEPDGLQRVDNLPAGDWTVAVERGGLRDGVTFASAPVEIVAGELAQARLELDPSAFLEERVVQTELVLRLAPGWRAEHVTYRTERVDPPDGRKWQRRGRSDLLVPGEDGWWVHRVRLGELPFGKHRLWLNPQRLTADFEVDGSAALTLDFPRPLPLEVRVFEHDGVTPIEGVTAIWNVSGATAHLAETAPGVYTGSVEGGEGQVVVMGGDLSVEYVSWNLTPTSTRVDVIASGTGLVTLRFEHDGEAIDVPLSARFPTLQTLEGGRVLVGYQDDGSGVQVRVPAPGSYRLLPSPISGYDAPEAPEFDLVVGDELELTLEYTPSEDG